MGNYLNYLPLQDFVVQRALAQAEIEEVEEPAQDVNPAENEDRNKLGLIAILVEDGLMDDFDMRGRVMTYADSAQERTPHSKSFVMEVDKNESTFRIASLLEKLYFEGIDTDLIDGNPLNNNSAKEDNNQLIGVVLIGNVPIPVVHEGEGMTAPSIYPYTDFYRKAYIYNHESGQFEVNDKVSTPTPEVWHGLIVPPSKDPKTAKQELIGYFDKNYEFSTDNPEFADFEKRVLYANFPEMEKQMNYLDYSNYGRYLKYMEELVMNRYNKHLLKEMVKDVSISMGSPDNPIMDDATIDNMYDVHTENIFKKYAYNFAEALRIYRSGINGSIEKTGRWSPAEVDSPESLVTLRDEYGKHQIKRKQLILEKEVDEFIQNNVSFGARKENIFTKARLKVEMSILGIEIDSNTFDFEGYFDGQKASDILVSTQCGIKVGQQRLEGQSVLENNSVMVNANRMYNPDTLLTPPEDDDEWELEETETYEKYAGCVFNNSIAIEETETRPSKCRPESASASIYDILGSIEANTEEAVNLAGRCDVQKMTFRLPNLLQYFSVAASGFVVPISLDTTLTEVIDEAYEAFQGNFPNADPITKGSFVVQRLIASGQSLSYSPIPSVEIEISVATEKKAIDTLYSHVEPTNETIKAIKHIGEPRMDPLTGQIKFPQITTPGIPADGIRYISFARNSTKQAFEYLNLFRVNGDNQTEITKDLLSQIAKKQQELNTKTTSQSDLFEDFFVDNSEIIEPIIWRAASIDQKLADIIPKYVDRDSFMPTPFYNPRKSPQNKPKGYEVMHIIADGDAQGYQFGLNRAMLAQAPSAGDEGAGGGTGTGGPDGDGDGSDTGDNEGEGEYLCGDPAGVEIWEWFEALQCWIEEEILPAEELFNLDDSCVSAPIPDVEETSDDIFDQILSTAATFDVEMKRKSLVPGQEEPIKISALNEKGEPVFGYIDMPIRLELDDPSLGTLSNNGNDVYIYTGERVVKFKANKTGSSKLRIIMDGLPEPENTREITIDVYDSIGIKWGAAEEVKAGRSEFTISVTIKDANGGDITNINDQLLVAPEQPADGGFENDGKIELLNGRGTIKFVPTPGRKAITLISKDKEPGITGEPFVIHPTAGGATQIILRAPPYIPIGTEVEMKVIAADNFGFADENFKKTISLTLDEKSKEFASLSSPTINMVNGEGIIKIKGGKETADIKLTATHEDLKGTQVDIPLLARVDSTTWKKTYPQNLFASFVGFPAGDFTQEDYFGGTHLFAGKTEAVYSFLSAPAPQATVNIAPNHFITITEQNQIVYVEFPSNELLLQAFDQKTMQTLISKKVALDFDSVERYENEAPEVGKMYVDILDTNFAATKHENGLQIKNLKNEVIANIQPNNVQITGSEFKWEYEAQPEYNVIELSLTNGLLTPARVFLSLEPETIKPENFGDINPNLKWSTIYGGTSTNDPTGLTFYAQNAEVPEVIRNEFYGLEGQQKYLSLFASGTNAGDAVKFNMPTNAILLGDPTIKLRTKSISSLNYNSATGQQLYEDSEGQQIASINHFNFNNDGYQDIVLLTEDGRVRLLEGGATEPPYKDKGNIAFLVDGGVAIEAFDFEKDNYEDLVVATDEGRLAILHNDKEVVTRSDHKLNIGKKMYKILKGDMDQDSYEDLVILDSRGDIYIFYYNSAKGKFPENGKWIANYGYSLKLNDNLNTDLDIRYAGMSEPSEPGQQPGNEVVPPGGKPPLEGYEIGGSVPDFLTLPLMQGLIDATQAAANDPVAAAQASGGVPKLPWPEGDEIETYFAPIESVGSLNVSKKVINKDRPGAKNVDLEETLTYTIRINSGSNLNNVVIADTVPDALSFDKNSVTCLQGGCQSVEAKKNSVKVFFSGLNLSAGQTTIISYDVFVAHTPAAGMLIQKISEPNENLPNPNSIIDQYFDILVSPPYNNTGKLLMHYTTGPRSYETTESNDPEPPPPNEALSDFGDLIDQMKKTFMGKEFSEGDPPPEPKFGNSFASVLDKLTGNDDCFESVESGDDAVGCVEEVLDDIGAAIAGFSCMGGGCFPMPFNMAFLVPPQFPLPIFAFPTTLPTPIGPMPAPAVFGAPSIIGAANVPGPIMSAIRFYLSPTLTGGIGIAMCWGPYPVSPTVPPPVFPIPYPPPVGNCMVTAIPADALYGGVCSEIEKGITAAMDAIAAGVNKINSTVDDINNNPNIPASIQQGGPDQGAGGLEISLAVNLGESMKFDPPAKAFSNVHIPTFDSIGGVISGWFDRQVLEIKNKLLTLPTFSIFLPDVKSLFTSDFQKTEKQFESWKNTMSGSANATLEVLKEINDADPEPDTERETVGQIIRGGLEDVSGSKILQYTNAIETQASIYNLNALEGLYDVASTLPLVQITEKPIQFDIPWLSAAEIQAWIMEAQNWVIYYEREYARVKDKWEELTCDDQPDLAEGGSFAENSANCAGRHLADAFGVNLDPVINSVKENIEVLQAWLNWPKQLIKFKQQLADYIRQVACHIDVVAQMMGGWMATLQQQMISWAELILTIVEIIDNIEDLFDLFIDFDANCDICTNERFANFGWWMLLGIVLPEIPIIIFPKIPDIVLDMSNMDAAINIELPILQIRPKPIPLPPLPYIRLPDLPTISLLLTLPPLPILPKPPELPDLPELPAIPTLRLPTLPVPPKLPDVAQAFEAIIPIIEKILEIWCIMKKSFAPVPEQMLNDQITLLTNRPAYLIPLDIIKLQLPNIALFDIGFNELRIETIIYLGLRINIIAKPIEDWVEEANKTTDGWINAMNQFYQDYIIETERAIQEKLDEAEAAMAKGAEVVSEGCIDYDWEAGECLQTLQGAIDESLGKLSEEADKWLKDKEGEWQKFADENGIELDYEGYYNAINNANEAISEWSGDAADEIKKWFTDNADLINGMNLIMGFDALEYLSEGDFGEDVQEVLDLVGEIINQSFVLGPTVLLRLNLCLHAWPDCKDNKEAYFGGEEFGFDEGDEASATINPELPKENELIAQAPPIQTPPVATPQLSAEDHAKQIFATPQGQEIKSLLVQMTKAINDVNENELVDYTVLKEKFGVPDYKPLPRKTTVDKLQMMRDQLIEHSDRLMAEVVGQRHITDLSALAGKPTRSNLPYELAETELDEKGNEVKVFTNTLPAKALDQSNENPVSKAFMRLEERVERTVGQISEVEAPAGGLGGACLAAVCLPDPVTKKPVPVIPYINLIGNSETLFMPNGHLAYSDGTGLYLKRDLTLVDDDINTDTGTPRRYEFDQIASQLRISDRPREAVNMLQSALTENGASTFTWKPTAHPDLYGYGIELERTISGYDTNKQNNQLADTKIILLPPNDQGDTPEVTANGQSIGFGTLVTSLTDEEVAAKKFGVSPRNIVTGADEIRFPTISNALIKVGENKAVYFDQLEGSAYSVEMENGYYQIKMTWFDEQANTASYNQNEILAPQIYAGSAAPIDVSQTDTFYMPIFKDKAINASEIFVDLSGAYNYYWYINPDTNTLTPEVGNTLNIPAQNEEKSFKVKLVATQNIEDESFETFEKTFTMVVYVPTINLDPEQITEGIIAGDMTPIPQAAGDDLSDIPFSVFRKRLGTWKNIGILRAENPDKTATSPDLGTDQSYNSIDSGGSYYIEGFEPVNPSPIILKDHEGNILAQVNPDSGLIELNNPNFDIKAVPAGTEYPTHIAITKKETDEILGNIYYISSASNNVTIKDEPLTLSNVESSGVTVGDANTGDDIVAAVIPVNGPSFPGGVAIFEDEAQENVALVDKDGTIRMMKAGYELRIKNKTSGEGRYIFQIVTDDGGPVFDIFIQADFDNLQIDSTTDMSSLNTQIGFLKPSKTAFAQSTPEVATEAEAPPVPQFEFEPEEPREVDGNPFPDVDEGHPFFSQILELYKSRVISGYADGSFKPDQKLTRAEFIKIALGVTNCVDCTTPNAAIKEKFTNNPFPDVSLPSWYFFCISIAKELGMVTGYGDGFFRPERNISRAEAAAVLLRQSGIEITEAPENAFVDVPDYAWYVDYVYTAVEIGLIKVNFGLVAPDEEITRGEFAFMAAGVKDLSECRIVDTDGDGVPDWWEMTHGMDMFAPDAEKLCPCYDSPWPKDTDGDGIKDVCDLDIDNDGVLNPLCIFTDTGEIDPKKLAEGVLTLGEPLDNCIFDPNEDQIDYDSNTIGNICEPEPPCACEDNPNQNDTDGDGIRDVCDEDIDNDGVLQPICIFDESGLLDRSKLTEKDDNCVFIVNEDQVDEDGNTYGDVCELGDLCPTIPEDLDGVDDEDGCPELNDNFPAKAPGVYVGPAELCGLVDFATDFMGEDSFMTAITDLETHEILFSESKEVIYSQ